MFDAGVKETLCTHCTHREVCAYGKIASKKVFYYDFISEVSVGCKYHQNHTETYRSGEATL